MIYTKLNRITENIIQRDWMYWRMYQKDGTSVIAECVNLEGLTPKKSADYLTEEINALDGTGYVVVKLYQQPPKQGGNNSNSLTFYIQINGSDDDGIKGTNNNPFKSDYNMISGFYNQINNLQLELLKKENEFALKELERKFSKKEKSTSLDPLIMKIMGLAEAAINGKNQVPNNNYQRQPEEPQQTRPINGLTDDDKQVFADTLKGWAKVDPDYFEALKAIKYFAETDYNTYRFYIDQLIINYKNKKNG